MINNLYTNISGKSLNRKTSNLKNFWEDWENQVQDQITRGQLTVSLQNCPTEDLLLAFAANDRRTYPRSLPTAISSAPTIII